MSADLPGAVQGLRLGQLGTTGIPVQAEADIAVDNIFFTQMIGNPVDMMNSLTFIARWAGWSLSVPFPAKSLSRHGDPDKAVPPDGDDPEYRTDEAITAFKVRASYRVVPGSLPRLRFGARYRVRARAVRVPGDGEPGRGVDGSGPDR